MNFFMILYFENVFSIVGFSEMKTGVGLMVQIIYLNFLVPWIC